MTKRVGVLALVVAACGVVAAEPALKGKTAYVNLTVLIKGYTKYQRFQTDTKSQVDKIEAKVKRLKGQLDAEAKTLTQPDLNQEEREACQKRARELQRQLEDLTVEGRSVVGRSTEGAMVELYKDVREVVAAYARQEGLDAVLHYNDATPGTPEFYAPPNVGRKMQAGAAMPLYLAPGIDITEAILTELNDRDKKRDE